MYLGKDKMDDDIIVKINPDLPSDEEDDKEAAKAGDEGKALEPMSYADLSEHFRKECPFVKV